MIPKFIRPYLLFRGRSLGQEPSLLLVEPHAALGQFLFRYVKLHYKSNSLNRPQKKTRDPIISPRVKTVAIGLSINPIVINVNKGTPIIRMVASLFLLISIKTYSCCLQYDFISFYNIHYYISLYNLTYSMPDWRCWKWLFCYGGGSGSCTHVRMHLCFRRI